jgi:hypothetical protein
MQQVHNGRTANMADFVEKSLSNGIEFQNSSYYTVIDGIIEEDYNIFRDRYYAEILSYTELRAFNETEFDQKYKFRPKRLSNDLYGSIDYWYLLLLVNDMSNPMDFKKRLIRVFTSSGIDRLRDILKKEEEDILKNKADTVKDYLEYCKDLKMSETVLVS